MPLLAEPSANLHSSGMHQIPLESPETSRNLWGTDKTLLYTPWAFAKPVPVPVKTHTPGHRYRFSGVPVQVALENPRITHANPYSPHEY